MTTEPRLPWDCAVCGRCPCVCQHKVPEQRTAGPRAIQELPHILRIGGRPIDLLAAYEIERLRHELRLAEEGLANATQEIEQYKAIAALNADTVRSMQNYDGAPYCSHCGAKSKKHCKCPPHPEND